MDPLSKAIDLCIDSVRVRCGVPGCSVSVYVDGERCFHGGSGSADGEGHTPISADAPFPSYSITKTMTAISALRLAERGVLSLDDTLDRWVKAPPWSGEVSLRQLLGHTAGVPNYSGVRSQIEALEASPRRAWSFDEFVRETCFRGLDFQPGEGWAYSNTGYMLVRRVLELCAGAPLGDIIAEHVCRPLGLEATFPLTRIGDFHALTPGFSERFTNGGEARDVRGAYDPGWCATGVMASTADEVCRIFEGLFAGRLLQPESLAEMLTLSPVPGVDVPGEPSYGLGIMANPETPLGPEYGHGGGGPGYDLRVSHFPELAERSVSLAAMCNSDRGDGGWTIVRAVQGLLAAELPT